MAKIHPDILLVPPVTNPVLISDDEDFIPVGLLALIASLRTRDLSAEIYKPGRILGNLQDYEKMGAELLEREPKTIGFSTWCHSFPSSILIAKEIKRAAPSLPVIMGGPQASVLAAGILEHFPFIDYVLKGEADLNLPVLLSCLLSEDRHHEIGEIQGIAFLDRTTGSLTDNPLDCFVPDLDILPVPEYKRIYSREKLKIDAGRGCPYQCKYCSTNRFFSRRHRLKSIDRIIEEMDYCRNRLRVRSVGFTHDMLTLNKEFIFSLSRKLREHYRDRGISYYWSCSARTDCLTEQMLDAMWESGCRALFLGIETGSAAMQKMIGKNLDTDEAHSIVAHAAKLGYRVSASYITGLPGEGTEDIDLTLRSALITAYSGAFPQASILSVLPGTEFYERYVDQLKYDGYTYGFSSIETPGPVREMIRDNRALFSSFYYLSHIKLSREVLIMVTNFINMLPQFIPTLRFIWKYLEQDLEGISIIGIIRNMDIDKSRALKEPNYDLELLIGVLKDYMEYLDKKPGFRKIILEIFLIDSMKAIVLRQYLKWQVIRGIQKGHRSGTVSYRDTDTLKVVPIWKLLSTKYNVYGPVRYPLEDWGNHRFRKGNYQFVLRPASDNQVDVIKVRGAYRKILAGLRTMSVADFKRLCEPEVDHAGAERLLKKLLKLNMLEIVTD